MIKKTIKKIFNILGFEIVQNYKRQDNFIMSKALERCYKRGIKINTVIDVGASNGMWTEQCMNIYPDANYLLFEAQEIHKKALDKFVNKHKNIDYILAVAGNKKGKIFFDNKLAFGGQAYEKKISENLVELPVSTIDIETKKRKLQAPFLIKLDTHGFEIPILEGATETLDKAELLIIETYNYKLTDNSLRYWEMNVYLEKLGFLPIEIVDFRLRKKDNSFWQMDTFYIKSTRKEFKYNQFK